MPDDRPIALVTAPFRGPGLDRLREVCDVVLDPWIDHVPMRIWDGAKLAERVAETGATVLVVESDFVMGDEIMDAGLIAIGSCRGDPNNVDVAAATDRGIPVMNAPGRNADGVAELAVALTLAASRHVIPADTDLRDSAVFRDETIPYQRYRAWQLAGRTVGIVGLGAVGRAAAWRFEGLGMRVISFDPFNDEATHDSLGALLAESDVVSMHAPPMPDTLAMMGAEQFAAMRDGAVYVNTARASLHDMDALTAALANGKLSAAALDHFEGEQLPDGHPLTEMANVVLTPHIGGATYDTEVNHSAMLADDIARLLAGEPPLHCVNPEVLK
ncbi:MAG: 3-phosphoglycerate dehydrogenase [Actinomycetia bacterium]|nr:3-phosphoglycerate dehydrogenase [Actinomycetes bacterium]